MSDNLKIYCVTDKPLQKLENSNLKLAGVGKNIFSNNYIRIKIIMIIDLNFCIFKMSKTIYKRRYRKKKK